MPPCLLQNTPYKGLFILILVFVVIEYLFNTVTDTRVKIFNSNKSLQYYDKASINYGPLLKTLLFKNNIQNQTHISTILQLNPRKHNFSIELSNVDYVITVPPFLIGNITTTYSSVAIVLPVTRSVISDSIENVSSIENITLKFSTMRPLCPDISQYLDGRVQIRYPVPSVFDLETRFAWLQLGGHWAPPTCTIEKKVAIIVPFRERGEHLLIFLQHMHPFLKKQQLDYTIFVVEQEKYEPFNRATLMNVGYVEALKYRKFDCFIFHDVDLLPEDNRNLYTCPEQPRHMSVAVDMFEYKLPYPAIFGGVSAISTEHFKLLNGFSNSFWGWGGEDDDMSNRIRYHHLYISRYPITIARYTMLTHKKDSPNPNRYELLKKGEKLFDNDGLNNLTYALLRKKQKLLYTWIFVKLKPPHAS